MENKTYSDYFDIDDSYYPEINPNSMKDPNTRWNQTFPHPTFVKLLHATERMLARETGESKKGIWIEGAYGTGKSRVAWTLKSLLECSPHELDEYFGMYDALRGENDLRSKLIAEKQGRIVVAYRYGSGEVTTVSRLVMAVFEGITAALKDAGYDYRGERTIRGRMAAWLADDVHRQMFEIMAAKPEHCGRGSLANKSVDDIIGQLSDLERDASELVADILAVAEAEGIKAFELSMEDLTAWISEVIEENRLTALVLVWDEFSSFFKNNRTSLDEFQKLAELASEKPFYLMIVTHMSGSLSSEGDQSFKIVRDRFVRREIELPDSVAFDLIGHALKVKPAARQEWEELSGDLNSRMPEARRAVAAVVSGSTDRSLSKLLPIHPMAALLLKYISTTFASNQRSMFSFIKNADTDGLQAFQWFIHNHGPEDEDGILTIDYLWNFFYEKGTDDNTLQSGRSNLDFIVAATLDTYPSHERELNTEERRVLKAVLMMQAISQKLNNSVEILRPNKKNLDLAFQGDSALENGRASSIATNVLVGRQKILYINPTAKGDEYAASAVSGDQVAIDTIKQRKLDETRTRRLIEDAGLGAGIESRLPPALQMRFEIRVACVDDFRKAANDAANKEGGYQIQAVLCFARNEDEQIQLRRTINEAAAKEQHRTTVFIDATTTLLGVDHFDEWATFSANEEYWRNKDANQADNQKRNADQVLAAWKSFVVNGSFEVNIGGEKKHCANFDAFKEALFGLVMQRYPLAFDRARVSESFFTCNGLKNGALRGIKRECGGSYQQASVTAMLGDVLHVEGYWDDPRLRPLPVSRLKRQLDDFIKESLSHDARVGICAVYDFLAERGFMPCNMYAYLMGFLLREYTDGSYRYGVGEAGEDGGVMTPEKLADFIDECMKHRGIRQVPRYREKYLEVMTQGQRRFVEFACEAFGVPGNLSVEQTVARVRSKITELGCPIWCLKDTGPAQGLGVFIDGLASVVSPRAGESVPVLADEFGRNLIGAPAGTQGRLAGLMTREGALDALKSFLESYEGGALLVLGKAIGVANVVDDVRRVIAGGAQAWLWDQSVGMEQLAALLVDYRIIDQTNAIEGLGEKSRSFASCERVWVDFARFTHMPCQDLCVKVPQLGELFRHVREIVQKGKLAHDKRPSFLDQLVARGADLVEFLALREEIFAQTYADCLSGLGADEIASLYRRLPASSFTDDRSTFARSVKESADALKAGQRRHMLHELWKQATQTQDGHEWSRLHETPILAMVAPQEQDAARRLFGALHSDSPSDADVEVSIEFLKSSPAFMGYLGDEDEIDEAFSTMVLGKYRVVLTDLGEVRRRLLTSVSSNAYDWCDNRRVADKIREMADSAYRLGASSNVASFIDNMNEADAKEYLKRLVLNDVEVGVAIMSEGEATL